MKKLRVNLGSAKSYDIIMGAGLMTKSGKYIKEIYEGKRIFVVSDKNVKNYYMKPFMQGVLAEGFEVFEYIIEPGEKSKNLTELENICSNMVQNQISRTDLLVALGGGVVGDLAGFAASSYLRGIDFVQIPTSLLAQVDSSVGGKVAVDLKEGKNLVGAFYQPKRVIIDTDTLDTLKPRFYRDGMAEVIKYGCIFDQLFLEEIESLTMEREHLIHTCCDAKAGTVEADEYDRGVRMFLNFGHTIGHAIESYYEFDKYTHGEAVAIGMYTITKLSEKKGITEAGTAKRIKKVLMEYELPWEFPYEHKDDIIKNILNDKKNIDGNLNVILINSIGDPVIYKTDLLFFEEL